MQPVLLWFRRNLRLSDNAALIAAAESGRPVIDHGMARRRALEAYQTIKGMRTSKLAP
ncbi:MAG: deoxyribodipyrimidine photo-lyase [Woeseiaceae bacterium]